jgi:hypothetical protein
MLCNVYCAPHVSKHFKKKVKAKSVTPREISISINAKNVKEIGMNREIIIHSGGECFTVIKNRIEVVFIRDSLQYTLFGLLVPQLATIENIVNKL